MLVDEDVEKANPSAGKGSKRAAEKGGLAVSGPFSLLHHRSSSLALSETPHFLSEARSY